MNVKKNQQFNSKKNNIAFVSHLKECNKLIFCNFFLSLGFFFLLFKIIQIFTISQRVPFYLNDLAEDNFTKVIAGIIFSVFVLLCSSIYIFWSRHKALNILSKENLTFFGWNFYFALIPIFGLIYLFIWAKIIKKKYAIKMKYSLYYSLFSLVIINMFVIVVYWMIYMLKGGISYINIGDVLSNQPVNFTIPSFFDLFILPIEAIIGWVKILYIKPAFDDPLCYNSLDNNGAIFCILILLLVVCYSLVASTSTFDVIINNLILKTKGETKWIIILPMIIVCLLSHFLGMYHEVIIFYPIYGKFLLLVGFDLLTVFYIFFFPITIGYGTSLFNPHIINVLKIETNPWLKMGVHVNFLLLVALLAIVIPFILNYASKTLNNLMQSVVYDTTIMEKNNSDFLQKKLFATEKKVRNFHWFVFAISLLLFTNHNWLYYFDDFFLYINFFKTFFFWITPPFHFIPCDIKYASNNTPLIPEQRYLYLQTNYWIILCYCFFFIVFNYKEISWQNFIQNLKKFTPFIIAIILCKAIEINFRKHGLFTLVIQKFCNFIIDEPLELKTIILVFLFFITLLIMVNPLLGSSGILFIVINSALITKGIGYATYYHIFLSSTIIVNLLSPTSLLLPFLIYHKISYSTYIKSSWKLILSLILVISIFACCHKYLLILGD